MKKAKIVIGANFGDEGKGLATDYFASEAKKANESCLVVCHNGGSQKGHTVVTPSGVRHVFHHFGSGCFCDANTYLAYTYIVNPIIFNQEYKELNYKDKEALTMTYVDYNARLTTPIDMMLNQIIEESRGSNKHGSCGLGIYETILRDKEYNITVGMFKRMSYEEKFITIYKLFDCGYMYKRLKDVGVDSLSIKWSERLSSFTLIIEKYIEDFYKMIEKVIICNDDIVNKYDTVVFEGAQGLLLDQNRMEYFPHLTPSNTGLVNPINIIKGKGCTDIEVCYITRTYMTRHGAGKFNTEVNKDVIGSNIIDMTNVPNEFQDTLRYGKLNLETMNRYISEDFDKAYYDTKKSLMITHLNETDNKIIDVTGEYNIDSKSDLYKYLKRQYFDNIYTSNGMTRDNVKIVKEEINE